MKNLQITADKLIYKTLLYNSKI